MKPFLFYLVPTLFLLAAACSQNPEGKARQFLEIGDYERALPLFEKAIQKNPKSYNARIGYAQAWLQGCAYKADHQSVTTADWQKAVQYLEQAQKIKNDPTFSIDRAYRCCRRVVFRMVHQTIVRIRRSEKRGPHPEFRESKRYCT